jgi:Ni/Fe-hydrogenase subunit HybB-like protein
LVIFGVLCERYVIVIPGLTHPPELIAGMEITQSVVEEGIATYSISFLEVLQAFGVFGVIAFMFGWGLKYLKLLPTEARNLEQATPSDSLVHS